MRSILRPCKTLLDIKVRNNEQIGILTEKVICNIHNIDFGTKRNDLLHVPQHVISSLTNDVTKCVIDIPITRHIGGMNQAYDYELENNKRLSVKSLYNSKKICPQSIGQTSVSRLKAALNIKFDDFKQYFLENKETMVYAYLRNLFKDGMLIVFDYKHGVCYKITIDNAETVTFKQGCHFETSRALQEWKESTTVYLIQPIENGSKTRKITIGEVQVHNNRSCCKFRFDIHNIIHYQLLEHIDVETIELDNTYKIKKDQQTLEESVELMKDLHI